MNQGSISIAAGILGRVLGFVLLTSPQVAQAGGTMVGTVTYNGKPEEKAFSRKRERRVQLS